MKSVCICGSQRFKEEIEFFANKLKELGVPAVFEPEFKDRSRTFLELPEAERLSTSGEYRMKVPGLVHAHLQRIREADVIYVFNPNGYIGINTTLEIGFAHGLNKIIYVYESEPNWEQGGELCREILYNSVIKTPKELYEKLK